MDPGVREFELKFEFKCFWHFSAIFMVNLLWEIELLRIAWIMDFPNCFECGKILNCLELLGSWFFRIALNSIRIANGPAGAPGPGGAPPGPGPGPARPRAPGHRPGRLQFELNSKQFGKTMIQAIPSNSIFYRIRSNLEKP